MKVLQWFVRAAIASLLLYSATLKLSAFWFNLQLVESFGMPGIVLLLMVSVDVIAALLVLLSHLNRTLFAVVASTGFLYVLMLSLQGHDVVDTLSFLLVTLSLMVFSRICDSDLKFCAILRYKQFLH